MVYLRIKPICDSRLELYGDEGQITSSCMLLYQCQYESGGKKNYFFSGTGTTGGGLFGSTNTQTSGFGTFGQPQQAGAGLFGGTTNTSTGTSLFGAAGTTTGSLFGQPAATTSMDKIVIEGV